MTFAFFSARPHLLHILFFYVPLLVLPGDSDPTTRKMALMSVPADRLLPPEVTMVRVLLFPFVL